eukprot:7881661-Heterocapsa_arctica.AAC.1
MARRTSKRNLGRVLRPTSPRGIHQDFRGRSMRRTTSSCYRKQGSRGSRSAKSAATKQGFDAVLAPAMGSVLKGQNLGGVGVM